MTINWCNTNSHEFIPCDAWNSNTLQGTPGPSRTWWGNDGKQPTAMICLNLTSMDCEDQAYDQELRHVRKTLRTAQGLAAPWLSDRINEIENGWKWKNMESESLSEWVSKSSGKSRANSTRRRVVFPSKINIVFTDYFIMVARLLHCRFPWLVLQFEYD